MRRRTPAVQVSEGLPHSAALLLTGRGRVRRALAGAALRLRGAELHSEVSEPGGSRSWASLGSKGPRTQLCAGGWAAQRSVPGEGGPTGSRGCRQCGFLPAFAPLQGP